MNEKLQIAFDSGGLSKSFIYGMNMMSECLQQLPAKNEKHSCTSDKRIHCSEYLPELLPLQYCRAAVQQR